MKFDREVLKGHLKVIVLATLKDEPCHAYALKKQVEEKSLEVFTLTEGTLYPTLHKLEKDGLIESEKVERENKPDVRVYSLTTKGIKLLEESKRQWSFFSRAMNMLLND